MIRKNQLFLNRVNALIDMLLVVLSYTLASWLRLDFFNGMPDNMAAVSVRTVFLAFAYALTLLLSLSIMGFYNVTRTRRLNWKIRTIALGVTFTTLFATTLLFMFRLMDFSRGVILVFYLTALLLLIGKYSMMRLILNRFRGKGYNLKHVVVIGTGQLALQYRDDLKNAPELGFHIKGFIGDSGLLAKEDPYLGSFERLDSELVSPDISEAIIALDPADYPRIREIVGVCERNGVKYAIIPFYNDLIPANPSIDTIGRSKLINMRANELDNIGWSILKRGFDLAASGLGLLILSPLFLLIAAGVKLSSPGPVLFRQTRVGYEKKEFKMVKFRSMRQNAQEETAWTKDEDPRRTKFGAFLRKTSMDELPQLWNVFMGEMSLVGPRPELPYFVDQFREKIPLYMVKHQVRPGMTGWAQVNGYRGDTSIERRIELDLWYIEHWSPMLDVRILLKTIFGGIINSEKTGKSQTGDEPAEDREES